MIMVFAVLIGALFMPALIAVSKHLPWLIWRLALIAAAVIRDEIVKAILLALAAAAGFASVLQYFG